MKRILIIIIALMFVSSMAYAGVYVNGYYRDTNGDGYKNTYVQPHYRSSPNHSTYDNYSTKGNTNPYTGQTGTVNPNQYRYKTYRPSNNNGSLGMRYLYGN